VRFRIVGVPPVRAVEVISPFDGFLYGFLDGHRLFSQPLRIVNGKNICSHFESRHYSVSNLREVPCPRGYAGDPCSIGNAAPPIKRLREELRGEFHRSFCTASAVPTSGVTLMRRGGMRHTARLTADEIDPCWRCHQEMREFLLTSALTSTRIVPALHGPRDQ
jgi:hypothetical protein